MLFFEKDYPAAEITHIKSAFVLFFVFFDEVPEIKGIILAVFDNRNSNHVENLPEFTNTIPSLKKDFKPKETEKTWILNIRCKGKTLDRQ